MQQFEFQIRLTAQEYLNYYRGTVSQVVASSTSGATVQFPAALLKPFVTSGGIYGRFLLTCDDDHKNSQLKKIG
ncbi:MAG: DUF2835 family protein [Rhodoferax sp.]|jgi:hypothetical protein